MSYRTIVFPPPILTVNVKVEFQEEIPKADKYVPKGDTKSVSPPDTQVS